MCLRMADSLSLCWPSDNVATFPRCAPLFVPVSLWIRKEIKQLIGCYCFDSVALSDFWWEHCITIHCDHVSNNNFTCRVQDFADDKCCILFNKSNIISTVNCTTFFASALHMCICSFCPFCYTYFYVLKVTWWITSSREKEMQAVA